MPISSTYSKSFRIPASAIDENGHVNNVAYVQWMQDIAVEHYEAIGGVNPMQLIGATWVVREHKIEYLLPAFANEEIEILLLPLEEVKAMLQRNEFAQALHACCMFYAFQKLDAEV